MCDTFQSPHRRGGSRDNPTIAGHVIERFTFQSPHRRGGSRDQKYHMCALNDIAPSFQSPHRRGGSRDFRCKKRREGRRLRFNPLIGGADRATNAGLWLQTDRNIRGFNPLIGGADRATPDGSPWPRSQRAEFQSPHRRGGSRDAPRARAPQGHY